MKTTGAARRIRVEGPGRIVLPAELRRVLRLQQGDELEISVEGERIILQKRQDVCLFCSAGHPEVTFKDRRVCKDQPRATLITTGGGDGSRTGV